MRRLTITTIAAILLMSAPALAQPGPPPGPPPAGVAPTVPEVPLWHPRGLVWGVDIGIGGMSSDEGDIECLNCEFSPLAVEIGFGIGLQLGPRFQLRADVRAGAQTLDADGTAFLVQSTLMAVARYFVTPRFWIEGGVGPTVLNLSIDDGYVADDETLDTGGGGMAAAGFEVAKGERVAISIEGRIFGATYPDLADTITTGTIGVRFDFYPRPVVYVAAY